MAREDSLSATTGRDSTWPTRTSFSAPSSACMRTRNLQARASGWRPYNGSSTATAGASAPKAWWARGQLSISHFRPCVAARERWISCGEVPMGNDEKVILLVEDNADDEALAKRAFKKNNVMNNVVVARDGVQALDYLFGTGAHAGRDLNIMPTVVLLDLKLPKVDGLEVLRRLRADARTRLLPVV